MKLSRIGLILIPLYLAIFAYSVYGLEIKDVVKKEDIEAAKRLKSFWSEGTTEISGLKGKFQMAYAVPDKIYLNIDMAIISIMQGFDGETAWMIDQNGQLMELTGSEKKAMINTAYTTSMSYLLPGRMDAKINYHGDTLIDNIKYSGFTVQPVGGDSLRLYFNRNNGRLEITTTWLDEIAVHTYNKDFRGVEGFNIPFKSVSISSIPMLNSTMTFTEVDVNTDVDSSLFEMTAESEGGFAFPEGSDSVVVHFEFRNGHIYLIASINDNEPVYFILDSGAGVNILSDEYAKKIGLEASGELPAKGVAGYGAASVSKVDSIKFGKIVLYDQVVGTIDFGEIKLDLPGEFGGVIGFDLLSRMPFKVDYNNEIITFYRENVLTVPAEADSIPFEFTMKIPVIDAIYNKNIHGKFLLDLGNSLGLIFHRPFVESANLKETFTDIEELKGGVGGIGGMTRTYAATGTIFEIGDFDINSPPLLVAEAKSGIVESQIIDGNVGNLVLKDFVIILDYSNKKLYIVPPKD